MTLALTPTPSEAARAAPFVRDFASQAESPSMQLTKQASGMPLQIVHPANKELALTTRIRCEEVGDAQASPRVFVSCLVLGQWGQEHDWWAAIQPQADPESPLARLFVGETARGELETRGWELLSHLGYVPQGWDTAA